ncbi:DoxX family protein [Streptomyces sp. RHZ10]|uniref:DoxX family protein n=2 Tax=Streptomyces TaxID=1883 RepID=A0ABS2HPB4_9ACTN|nr:DoxX family protein [Streptomyces durocortorensis]MBM7052926.1 DoxX family protein [Streptomyces durocortorensis]
MEQGKSFIVINDIVALIIDDSEVIMFIAYAVIGVLLAFALGASAVLTFTRNEGVTASMSKVGVPESWYPWLASAKAAGALGLLIGLGVPLIGSAAAIGVALYFLGAVVTHLRAKDYGIAPPLVLALLAVAALVLRVLSA